MKTRQFSSNLQQVEWFKSHLLKLYWHDICKKFAINYILICIYYVIVQYWDRGSQDSNHNVIQECSGFTDKMSPFSSLDLWLVLNFCLTFNKVSEWGFSENKKHAHTKWSWLRELLTTKKTMVVIGVYMLKQNSTFL